MRLQALAVGLLTAARLWLAIHRRLMYLWLNLTFVSTSHMQVLAVDLHPAARLGHGILLDHGTGVVIGETAVIGNNVSLLQVSTPVCYYVMACDTSTVGRCEARTHVQAATARIDCCHGKHEYTPLLLDLLRQPCCGCSPSIGTHYVPLKDHNNSHALRYLIV